MDSIPPPVAPSVIPPPIGSVFPPSLMDVGQTPSRRRSLPSRRASVRPPAPTGSCSERQGASSVRPPGALSRARHGWHSDLRVGSGTRPVAGDVASAVEFSTVEPAPLPRELAAAAELAAGVDASAGILDVAATERRTAIELHSVQGSAKAKDLFRGAVAPTPDRQRAAQRQTRAPVEPAALARPERRLTFVLLLDASRPAIAFEIGHRERRQLKVALGFALTTCFALGLALSPTAAVRAGLARHGLRAPAVPVGAPQLADEQPGDEAQESYKARAEALELGDRRAAGQLLSGIVRPAWIEAAGSEDHTPGTLLWPVADGSYVRGYGSGSDGYHLAVDISGRIGRKVRAAAGGIVAYAGDEVRGYGNLVLLVHPGGWVTLYAHNQAMHVAAGQHVRRGQVIAALGNTGISRGPHVHFEFLHRGQNCDPAPLFRPGIRHGSGRMSAQRQVEWTDPGDRPSAVSCDPRRHHPNSRWNARHASADTHGPEADRHSVL